MHGNRETRDMQGDGQCNCKMLAMRVAEGSRAMAESAGRGKQLQGWLMRSQMMHDLIECMFGHRKLLRLGGRDGVRSRRSFRAALACCCCCGGVLRVVTVVAATAPVSVRDLGR